MGEEIQKEHSEQADYGRFQQPLEQETELLRPLFAKRAFDIKQAKTNQPVHLWQDPAT